MGLIPLAPFRNRELSYASADRSRVEPPVDALEKRGWSVWRDTRIPPGKTCDEVIEAALDAALCCCPVVRSFGSLEMGKD